MLLTADHGNDPTFAGTDHTREDVPLIAFLGGDAQPTQPDLGVRSGFFDVAQTLCDSFGLPTWSRGQSILPQILSV